MGGEHLCWSPPIGSTRPWSVISPVIPIVCFTGRSVRSEAIAVAIVMPALGPSFGIAPAGTCRWKRAIVERVLVDELGGARAHGREGDLCGFLHHVAELARQNELVAVLVRGRLDEENVPPVAVAASPVATPGTAVRSATSR